MSLQQQQQQQHQQQQQILQIRNRSFGSRQNRIDLKVSFRKELGKPPWNSTFFLQIVLASRELEYLDRLLQNYT